MNDGFPSMLSLVGYFISSRGGNNSLISEKTRSNSISNSLIVVIGAVSASVSLILIKVLDTIRKKFKRF